MRCLVVLVPPLCAVLCCAVLCMCCATTPFNHSVPALCASGELERAEKRLATLAGVRPPYMDEYEALTAQLQVGTQSALPWHGRAACWDADTTG